MRRALSAGLPRLVLTFLLALGLILSFVGVLDLRLPVLPLAAASLLFSAALETLSVNRKTALGGSVALAAAFLLWGIAGQGFARLGDLLRALTLAFSGVSGALPLVRVELSWALTLAMTLLSFLCSRKSAGSLPPTLLALGGLAALWLMNRPDLLFCMLPTVLSALCLVIMSRHPEVSLFHILPFAAAVALLAFGLTPRGGLVVPAWKEKADTLRQAILDRLFFTEPREIFSLSLEGYYPQGVSQLGGPVHPSTDPVMQVSTPKAAYLRGVLMNEYDGHAWYNTLGGRRYLWSSPGLSGQRTQLFDQNLPSEGLSSRLTQPVEISVRMLAPSASTLFVPQRVRDLRVGGSLVPYFTNSSELFITRNLQPGDTWSVTAPLFQAGDPGLGILLDTAEAENDPHWAEVQQTYLALPPHLEAPVWQLAADITAGLSSPYEKAFALQNYLSRSFRYSLDAPALPSNVDFVTGFLFSSREGYCTSFASALTVLCRMADLPSRYVEGYLAEPDSTGNATLTGLNAHAWTEVYFRGFGWVTFDATPHRSGSDGSDRNGDTSPDGDSEVTPTPESLPTATPPPSGIQADSPTPPPLPPPPGAVPAPGADSAFSWAVWLLILLILVAAALIFRWQYTSPARRAKAASQEQDRFDLWLADVILRLSAAGYTRPKGETLMTFTRRLDAEGKLPVPLGALGECASLLHYGRVHALETDTALAREVSLKLRTSLPRRARLRYALLRLKPGRRDAVQS